MAWRERRHLGRVTSDCSLPDRKEGGPVRSGKGITRGGSQVLKTKEGHPWSFRNKKKDVGRRQTREDPVPTGRGEVTASEKLLEMSGWIICALASSVSASR